MGRTRLGWLVLSWTLVSVTACSSTVVYEGRSWYPEPQAAGQSLHTYRTAAECEQQQPGQHCTGIVVSWQNERYCYFFSNEPPRISSVELRLDKPDAPYTWQTTTVDARLGLVFVGNDEDFAFGDIGGETLQANLVCTKFEPANDLKLVKQHDTLVLQTFCKSLARHIELMPINPQGYPLTVQQVRAEHGLIGCR